MDLDFSEDALQKVAEDALQKKTGARGLRSIIEHTLMDVMYELPSMTGVRRCTIDADIILGQKLPLLFTDSGATVEMEPATKKTA